MKLRLGNLRAPSLLIALGAVTIAIFQNCSPGFEMLPELGLGEFASGVMREDCMNSPHYDACLFYKNPTTGPQRYAVAMKLGANKQELMNESLSVIDWKGHLVRAPSWMIEFEQDPDGVVESAMSFYWSQRMIDLLQETKTVDLANAKFKIVSHAPFSGWSAEEGAIFLGSGSLVTVDAALDASVVAHLTTEAVISHLTAKAIYDVSTDNLHQDCGPLEGPVLKMDCCTSKIGCSRALTAGLSDYFTAVLFDRSPAIGDYVSGDASGVEPCGGIKRNPASNHELTFTSAYDSCKATGRSGQIFIMGSAFASSLFEIRSSLAPDKAQRFDALVTATLPYLKGTDSFETWLSRAISIDSSNFGGQFRSALEIEFTRRSL